MSKRIAACYDITLTQEGEWVMTDKKLLNGVDVQAVMDTVKAIEGKPEIADFKFRLTNKWVSGGHNRGTVGDFYGAMQENTHKIKLEYDADEPEMLAGTDKGANPVEYLLTALAACVTTTMVFHAAIRGIEIEELESELEGDIDLRGFLGLSRDVKRGYKNIRVKFRVKTAEENIEKLKALSKLSPVFNSVTEATRVDIDIERMAGKEAKAA